MFGKGFAYIVEQGRPAEPEIICGGGNVVHHLQGMRKIILVSLSVHCLNSPEIAELRQNLLQQSALFQKQEAYRGFWGEENLV